MLDLFGAFGQIDLARSAADIAAGRVRLTFGGTTYTLPVRSIRANREWKEALDGRLAGMLAVLTTAGEDTSAVLLALSGATGPMLDALVDYDHQHVLPPRDVLEDMAAELQVVRAIAEVWLAANPLLVVAATTLVNRPTEPSDPSKPTSSPPPRTGGRRSKSRKK